MDTNSVHLQEQRPSKSSVYLKGTHIEDVEGVLRGAAHEEARVGGVPRAAPQLVRDREPTWESMRV